MLHRTLLALVTVLASALTIAGFTTPAQAFTDRDCGDFATQAAAQEFYNNNGGSSDPHGLDADGDGIACDSNPCPCSTATGGGGGGAGGTGTTKSEPKTEPTLHERARVIRVVDGDTIEVRLTSGAEKDVRILGIDTPEVYGGTECWGPQASAAMKKRLPKGTVVNLTSDPTQDRVDRYGRILRYVAKGGKDVGFAMVRAGNAEVYVYGGNPFKRTGAYKKAENRAKASNRGMWGAC